MYLVCYQQHFMIRDNNNFWNFRLGQINHTIFWEAEGLRKGRVKKMLIVSCFNGSLAYFYS